MGGKFTDWAEALGTSALTLEPESEDTAGHDAAVSRLVARNARDKEDLAELLDAIGLPVTEDDLVPLLPLLSSSTDRPATGDPMTTSTPTSNAFFAVAVSMLKEGTDIATVLQTVDLSEAELAEALALAGRPAPDDTQPVSSDTTPPGTDEDAPGAGQEEDAQPADVPAPTEPEAADSTDVAPGCDRTEELLAWGEQHARSQQLAAQARAALAELARRRGNAAVIEQAKAKVAALENELARAREELQQAVGGEDQTAAAPAAPALVLQQYFVA
ncbi:hypothetical protein PV396_43835 [Streptomyces sp. ME02-8801-2C]|uniref:hypothetical protein n=1 Tax=Streptomyces sp. ME02-8801-2C TaxID=3028680 RepID=UPI0029A53E44|nr:hypothetical protein [Streptomyces sp. ME02-8801-2C]MDX3458777.1 hypothetical protein [Streptomyces sp. ME02-8801-2C]